MWPILLSVIVSAISSLCALNISSLGHPRIQHRLFLLISIARLILSASPPLVVRSDLMCVVSLSPS